MSKISSTTLFHFFDKKEWLLKILNTLSFSPRYVLEDFQIFKEKYLIEMKCFCDIPLSNINTHVSTYGNYGIGLSKEFAYRNYISPVQYFHEHSDPVYRLMSINLEKPSDWAFIIPYLKTMYSNNKMDYYYNEREWRYAGELINVSKMNPEEIEHLKIQKNSEIKKEIKIRLSEIKYIFIDSEQELELIINHILNLEIQNHEKYNLISKIVTSKQIKEDF